MRIRQLVWERTTSRLGLAKVRQARRNRYPQEPETGNPWDSGTHPQPKIDEMFWRHALRLGEEPIQADVPAPPEIPISKSIRFRPFPIIAAVVTFILLASVGEVLFRRSRANPSSVQGPGFSSSAFHIVPITSASGNAIFPTFSPDGREIAFIWDGPDRRRYDVYVQLVGADLPLRLTYSKSGQIGAPAWSPDGREIAFGRCDGENDGVYVVPALGGAERKPRPPPACTRLLAR